MTKPMQPEHKHARIASRKATQQRRSSMHCLVRTVKLNTTKSQENRLHRMFVEAKWFTNSSIGNDLIYDDTAYKNKSVWVRRPTDINDEFVFIEEHYQVLTSQCRQGINSRQRTNINALSTKKKAGKKVGRLKPKSEVNSIPLKQHGGTHKFSKDRRNRVWLTNFGWMKCHGWHQIDFDIHEITSATLRRVGNNFFIDVVLYVEKQLSNVRKNKRGEYSIKKHPTKHACGVDMGIKDTATTSDGESIKISVEESEYKKALQRQLARLDRLHKKKHQKKYSNNRRKITDRRRREEQHLVNKKHDQVNKFIAIMTSEYENIVIQDELIASWHKGLFGRQVQRSALGRLKRRFKESGAIVISSREATTKECTCCNHRMEIGLDDRVYQCDNCGHVEDRDVKSAKRIAQKGGFVMDLTPILEVVKMDLDRICYEKYTPERGEDELSTAVISEVLDMISTDVDSGSQCL